jgi:hypothetical protein
MSSGFCPDVLGFKFSEPGTDIRESKSKRELRLKVLRPVPHHTRKPCINLLMNHFDFNFTRMFLFLIVTIILNVTDGLKTRVSKSIKENERTERNNLDFVKLGTSELGSKIKYPALPP